MSATPQPQVGSVGWMDLTIPDAPRVRDFYKEVVGWTTSEVAMGEYSDFCMHPPGAEQPAAGVCHARGVNADLPPVWLVYITVADLDKSIARCGALGGSVLKGPAGAGGAARYAVISDPSGAVCALYQPAEPSR